VSEDNNLAAPPKQPKTKARSRRNYQAELIDLQGRVDVAVRILKKSTDSEANSPAAKELVSVAVETLTGEE